MADVRQIGKAVTNRAKELISSERGSQHGDVRPSFAMIGELWAVYLNNAMKVRYPKLASMIPLIEAHDVAEMMSLLKKARNVYGDDKNPDHSVDDIGYSALAAGLRMENSVGEKIAETEDTGSASGNSGYSTTGDEVEIPSFLRQKTGSEG